MLLKERDFKDTTLCIWITFIIVLWLLWIPNGLALNASRSYSSYANDLCWLLLPDKLTGKPKRIHNDFHFEQFAYLAISSHYHISPFLTFAVHVPALAIISRISIIFVIKSPLSLCCCCCCCWLLNIIFVKMHKYYLFKFLFFFIHSIFILSKPFILSRIYFNIMSCLLFIHILTGREHFILFSA